MPAQSISFIYQVQACQHMLVQPNSDSDAPSIPALTVKGFVRWQSIQILLAPENQVPVMQSAVRNWALKNPDSGLLFPVDLPAEAFPPKVDPEVERWHQQCAVKLREQATPKEEPRVNASEHKDVPRPPFPDRPFPYAHVRVDPSAPRDYFGGVGMAYIVPEPAIPRVVPIPGVGRSPERDRHRDHDRDHTRDRDRDRDRDRSRERERHRDRDRDRDHFRDHHARRQGSSSDEPGRRRRSDDHAYFPHETRSMHLPPRVPEHERTRRRHSQPRHISSSDSEDNPLSPRAEIRRRNGRSNEPPPISGRQMYGHDEGRRVGSSHPHLPSMAGDSKRRSIFDIKDKVMSFLPGADHERQRSGSRGRKDDGVIRVRSVHPKDGSRLRSSVSDYNSDETDTEESPHSRRRRREKERERDRDKDRTRELREREREKSMARERERSFYVKERPRDRDRDSDERRERDRDRARDHPGADRIQRRSREPSDEDLSPKTRSRGGSYLARPEESFRRASSHADIDRKRDWDPRDRDRAREDRYRDRERERDRDRSRLEREVKERLSSPSKGVSGRVYPDPWN